MTDIEFIEDLLDSYFYSEIRDLYNSSCSSSSFYVKEEARIRDEQRKAFMAMERIKEKLGVE
jgi:hypothetical protein